MVQQPSQDKPLHSPKKRAPIKAETCEQQLLHKLRRRRRQEHAKWASAAFKKLDLDSNGRLSVMEVGTKSFFECFQECLGEKLPGITDMRGFVDFVLGRGDEDGDRHLSRKEFENLTWRVKHMAADIDLETQFVFALFDPNRDGKLDFHEFEKLFNFQSRGGNRNSSKEYIAMIMKELDVDNDGSISPLEYSKWSIMNKAASVEDPSVPAATDSVVHREVVCPSGCIDDHRSWASQAFASLEPVMKELDARRLGFIQRQHLSSERFSEIIQECLGRPVQSENILPAIDLILKKCSTDGNYLISYEDFVLLTWKLHGLDSDDKATATSESKESSVVRTPTEKRGSNTPRRYCFQKSR
jgi:Ca2+-binding EF-hand superfamily protein